MVWEEQKSEGGIWLPEELGEELIGEVMLIDEGGKFGRQLIVKQATGDEIKTPGHVVLLNKIKNVKVGDRVRFVFRGTEPPAVKGNSPTKLYDVFIEKPDLVAEEKVE